MRATCAIQSLVTVSGPRVSPAMTTLLVVAKRLAGGTDRPGVDAGLGALAEEQIDDLVRDAIAHLVGVTLRNGFAGEQVGFACHPGPRAAFGMSPKNAGLSQALRTGSRTVRPGRRPSSATGTGSALACRSKIDDSGFYSEARRFAGKGAHEVDDGTAHTRIGDPRERLVELQTLAATEEFDGVALGRALSETGGAVSSAARPAPRRRTAPAQPSTCDRSNSRLAPIRLMPFSYFWICWKVRPRCSPSFSWLIPSSMRRRRTRLPT